MSESSFDIVIVGGGLVGASLAVMLAPQGRRVALIETAAPPATSSTWDERCLAINDGSRRIFEAMNVWAALLTEAEPIVSTHISEKGRFGVARFTAAEAGVAALGYNIPMRHLGQSLWREMQATPTTVFCPAQVTALEVNDHAARLSLTSGEQLTAKLVIAADGAQSAVRQLLGVEAETRDYEQSAIITAVRLQREHNGIAYERFTPGGPLAVLPKPGKTASLVWTVPSAEVPAMLAWSDEEFLAQAQAQFGERLGRFFALGRRNAYPLARVMSEQLTAPRVLFVGNAAQALHPVAAQGFNLGLRDVAGVVEALSAVTDPGAAEVLDRYARLRTQDREAVAGFTDRLVRTFSNRVPGLAELRHWGLFALDVLPPIKAAVMRQNLGRGAGTPQLLRDSAGA